MQTIKLLSAKREARSGSTLVICTFTEIAQEFIQTLKTYTSFRRWLNRQAKLYYENVVH